MIREFQTCDMEQTIRIWLLGNTDAHPFIAKEYWESHQSTVQEQFLQAEVYVYETNGSIHGFVGIQGDYLAGIFVEKEFRGMGIGKQLLDHVKKLHPALTLNVYKKNELAVKFYRREGFSTILEEVDQDTGEAEYTMSWTQ